MAPEVAMTVLTWKWQFSKKAQKVAKYLGFFSKNFFHGQLTKVA